MKCMKEKDMQRNIKLYYWYMALSEPLFWGPIIIHFILKVSGMHLSDFYFMESVMGMIIILLQAPTGSLADKFGRKKLILSGNILLCVGATLFAIANNTLGIWISNVVWTTGFACIYGADKSFLFDNLKSMQKSKDYKKDIGQATALKFTIIAMAHLLSRYLVTINLRLPMYLSIIPLFLNCIVISRFTEKPNDKQNLEIHQNKSIVGIIKRGIRIIHQNSKIKWFIGFYALVATISGIWFFTYNPYFELKEVDFPIKDFCLIFSCLNIVAAISSYYADWLSKKIKNGLAVFIMLATVSLPIIIMGLFVSRSSALLIILQNFTRGYLDPFTDHFIHNRIGSEYRATIMSIKSSVRELLSLAGNISFGFAINAFSLSKCLVILGCIGLICGSVLMIQYKRVFGSHK